MARFGPVAALVAAFCIALVPARADDPHVLFSVAPGDSATYAVSYWRGGALAGNLTPLTVIRYDLDVAVKSVSSAEIVATVTNTAVDATVDGQRMLTPPDFDSLVYLAADGVPMDITLSTDGIVNEVADWDNVRKTLAERAVEKAADNQALKESAEQFFANLDAVAAGEIFARPLALSAAGRIVKLEAPARRSVDAKGIALPSFTSNAKGNWTFSLVPTPPAVRAPDAVTIEWLGVPDPGELRAILGQVADQLNAIEPENAPAMAVIEKDARMWQRFLATYDPENGRLLGMTGQMELVAGPIQRKVAIEAVVRAD